MDLIYKQLRNAFNLGRAYQNGTCDDATALLHEYADSLSAAEAAPSREPEILSDAE